MQTTATKRRSKAKPQADGEGELVTLDDAMQQAAHKLGIHPFSLDLLAAFGVPGTPPLYGEILSTLAEVGTAYGVSERTVASWRARGMPGESGCFSLNHVERWRNRELKDAPRRFPERAVSNDMVRAVFDYMDAEAKFWVLTVLEGALESGILTEEQCRKLGEKFGETQGRVCPPLELRERMLNELAPCFQPPCD